MCRLRGIFRQRADQTIAAGAQLVIQTAGTASQAVVEGWAQLTATGGSVGGSVVIASQVTVPLETRNPSGFVLSFNNTAGMVGEIELDTPAGGEMTTVPVVAK